MPNTKLLIAFHNNPYSAFDQWRTVIGDKPGICFETEIRCIIVDDDDVF